MFAREPTPRRAAALAHAVFAPLAALALAVGITACGGPLPPNAAAPAAAAAKAAGQPDAATLATVHGERLEAVLGSPAVAGNQARLLVDGPATHRAMFDAIAAAREQVDVQTYILEAEGPGERLASLLERKRAQGVRVRVLYDSVGSLDTPKEYFERLQAAGVETCEFNPVDPAKAPRGWRVNNRNHRKVLIVDGAVAFTGGVNISSVYSSSPSGASSATPEEDGWRDTHVAARGPIVQRFETLFEEDWGHHRCGAPAAARATPVSASGGWRMHLVAADPERGESETYAALLASIGAAQRRVWLTYGYFVPDPATREALGAAALRGVDVRLVLPGVSDSWLPLYAGRSHYDELLRAGVKIFERSDALVHAKTAVIDGVVASVGSSNLDWRSFVHNYEADLLVLGPEFGTELERLFERDVAAAKPILLDAWQQRGVGSRFREWAARAWAYFL